MRIRSGPRPEKRLKTRKENVLKQVNPQFQMPLQRCFMLTEVPELSEIIHEWASDILQ